MNKLLKDAMALLLLCNCIFAQIEISGDVTAASTYTWRGVKQYNGPALQGTIAFSSGPITLGVWASSIDFGDEIENETDPFIDFSSSIKGVDISIGAVVYSYDMLETFNDDADYEWEVYLSGSIGSTGVSFYFVPEQNSTDHELNKNHYWIEVGHDLELSEFSLGLLYSYGTYSSRWLSTPIEDPVSACTISLNKEISESISTSFNYSVGIEEELDNLFWLMLSIGF